jgi:hypothetical protein
MATDVAVDMEERQMLPTTLLDPAGYVGKEGSFCLVARLGKDESDIAVKRDEKTVEVQRDPAKSEDGDPYKVTLFGDHRVNDVYDGNVQEVVDHVRRFAQLPHCLRDDQVVSDEDCKTYVSDLAEFLTGIVPSVELDRDEKLARVKQYEAQLRNAAQKRKKARSTTERELQDATGGSLDKLRQGKMYKEQDWSMAQRHVEAVEQMSGLLVELNASFLRSTFEAYSMEMFDLVCDVLTTRRKMASKILVYRTWDCTFGDPSLCVAHFFVKPLKQEDEMKIDDMILDNLKAAGFPQSVLTADGAFMGARAQTKFIGTRDGLAQRCSDFATLQFTEFMKAKKWPTMSNRRAPEVKGALAQLCLQWAHKFGRPKNELKELPSIPAGAKFFPAYLRCDDQEKDIYKCFYDDKADRKGDFHDDFRTMSMPEITVREIHAFIGRTDAAGPSPIELAMPDQAVTDAEIEQMQAIFRDCREGEICSKPMLRRLCLVFHAVDDPAVEHQYLVAELAQCRYEHGVHEMKHAETPRNFERSMSVMDPKSVARDDDNAHCVKVKMQAAQRQVLALSAAVDHKASPIPMPAPAPAATAAQCADACEVTAGWETAMGWQEENDFDLEPQEVVAPVCNTEALECLSPAIWEYGDCNLGLGSALFGAPYDTDAWIDSKILLSVAKKYNRFQPIQRWLLSKVDKQNVPLAMLPFWDRVFIACLWHYGYYRVAIILQVLGQFFQVWDCSNLQEDYRDYKVERGRYVIAALLGERSHSVAHLVGNRFLTKKGHGPCRQMRCTTAVTGLMQCSALYRDWCHADTREQLTLRLGFPALEKKYGVTDDVENGFAEMVQHTGYKPTAKKAEEVFARAEMDMHDRVDPEMLIEEGSLIRRTPAEKQQRHVDWNSGWCVETWWMTVALPVPNGAKRRKVSRSFAIERAAWGATCGKYTSVRAQHVKHEVTNNFGLSSSLVALEVDDDV